MYSVRPKAGAPVSTPLRWDEVNDKLNPSIYSMQVVLDRVRRFGDLYADVLTTRQSLTKALKAINVTEADRFIRHRYRPGWQL